MKNKKLPPIPNDYWYKDEEGKYHHFVKVGKKTYVSDVLMQDTIQKKKQREKSWLEINGY